MKATAELIVDAALSHPARGVSYRLQGVVASRAVMYMQQKLERHGRRKLRRPAKTSVRRVVGRGYAAIGAVKKLGSDHFIRGRSQGDSPQLTQHCGGSA